MHLIGKVVSVVGALGIVGGGVVAINHFYKGFRNVSERLIGMGFKVLDINGDTAEWQAVEAAYTQESNANKKFSGTLNAKENCKIALQNNPNDANTYKLASKWCVKVETMEQMLTRNKYTKLTKVPADEANKAKWKEKLENLKNYSGSEKITIDFNAGTEDNHITTLQGECDKIIVNTVKTHNTDDFEKKFIQAKEWCAIKNKS